MRRFTLLILFLTSALPLWPQTLPDGNRDNELFATVGLMLDDLIMLYGTPQSVHTARGEEFWQDDVVFVYSDGDFYIYHDRVWQVGLRSAYNIQIGDTRSVALLVFGERGQDNGDFILYPLAGNNWPLVLRVNINEERVSGIYVFRPDF